MQRSYVNLSGTKKDDHRGRGRFRRACGRALAGALEALERRLQFAVTFDTPLNHELTGIPEFSTLADFNEDGHVDLVASAYNDGSLNILFGLGDGSFDAAIPIDLSSPPDFVNSGDFDADGHADLVAVSFNANSVIVLLGNGDGSFQTATSYAAGTGPRAVVLGDFNGDNRPDLAVAKSFHQSLTILLNNGNGTFAAATTTLLNFSPTDLSVGDFNGDGEVDLAAADFFGNRARIMLGNGDGTFQTATAYVTGNGPASIATADLNADNSPDIITANYLNGTVSVLLNNGDGTFQSATSLTTGSGTTFVTTADLDQNGTGDIVAATANSIAVLLGNGNGTFQAASHTPLSGQPRSLSIADFDQSGLPDLAVNIQSDNIVGVFLAIGNPPPVARAGGPYTVAEGATVQLNGSTSSGTSLTYSWDLDNDGVFGETGIGASRGDETSATPTFSAVGLDGSASVGISLRVTDSLGVTSTATATINITNVAPTLTLSGSSSVNEGAPYTLSLGHADPGSDTISQWVINWGDGNTQNVAGNPSSVTHVYADGTATRTISATATDEDGTYSANTKVVTVNNVAPTLTISGGSSVNEGSTYTLSLAATDPGTDTISSWLINWGDGSTQNVGGNASSVTHVFADGTIDRTITATATDEDGTHTANSKIVTVNNVAPTLTIGGNDSVNEGSTYLLYLNRSDPGADTISQWVITWGDGSVQTINGNSAIVAHVYADGANTYTISATATDEDGTHSANTKQVSVNNVAPTLTIGGSGAVNEGSAYTLSLTRADPGADTLSGWLINWGDGTPENVTGSPSSVTHQYATAGSYTISATATDEDGTFSSNTISLTVLPPDVPVPVANAGGAYTVGEGGLVQLDGSASTGAGLTYAWDLDNDGIYGETGAGATRGDETGISPTFSASGLDGPGSFPVALRITDSYNTTSSAATSIAITNVAPSLTLAGNDSVNEGATYTLSLAGSDPGPDTISTWLINWGDGNTQSVAGTATSVTHVFADGPGSVTISATGTDEDGTYASNSRTVAVADVAPSLTISGASSASAGTPYTLGLGASDPGTDTIVQWFIDWGDGSTQVVSGSPSSASHTYAGGLSNGTIWATATNEDGTFSANSLTVDVAAGPSDHQAPSATLATPENVLTAGGAGYMFTVTYSDNVSLDLGSLDGDILVTGPNGFSQVAQCTAIAGSGGTVTATYSISAPGGEWDSTDNGTYTISLLPNQVADGAGNYAAAKGLGSFSVVATGPDIAGYSVETANDVGGIAPGLVRAREDAITALDRNDYYKFTVVVRSKISVKLYLLTDNAALMLLDANGNQLFYSNRSGNNHEAFAKLLDPGVYYFRVLYKGDAGTTYRLRYEAEEAKLPVEELSSAVPLGTLQPGVVRVVDDLVDASTLVKYYTFNLTSPMSVYAKLYNLTDNADLAVIDSKGNVLQTSNNTDLGMEGITLDLAAGTYYVQVTLAAPLSAGYRLRLAQA